MKVSPPRISNRDLDVGPGYDDKKFVEEYLEGLWDSRTVKYYTRPAFHSAEQIPAKNLKTEEAEQLFIGGYPNGMLRGLRVAFCAELKPWLKRTRRSVTQSNMEPSFYRRASCVLTTPKYSSNVQERSTGVKKLLDALLWHTRGRIGARCIWDLLRRHSNQIVMRLEEEMDKESRETFSVYARECVLTGGKEPPLCKFMNENPTGAIMETLRHLKAPELKNKVQKLRALVKQYDQLQTTLEVRNHQPDVKDLFTNEELSKLLKKPVHLKQLPGKELTSITETQTTGTAASSPSENSKHQLKLRTVPNRQVKRHVGSVGEHLSKDKPKQRLSKSAWTLEKVGDQPVEPLCWTQLYDQYKINDSVESSSYFSTETKNVGTVWPSPRGGSLLLVRGRIWKPRTAIAT